MSRKLSKVSRAEMEELNGALEAIFKKYKGDEAGVSSAGLIKFHTKCKLNYASLPITIKDKDVGAAFQMVKVGKKDCLNFDHFQEVVRKISIEKRATYQEVT